MGDLDVKGWPPDGDFILTTPRALSEAQRAQIIETVARALPDLNVLIRDSGMQLRRVDDSERLDRIESKLDTLIAALASDEEDEPQYSLDGELIPGERAEGTPL